MTEFEGKPTKEDNEALYQFEWARNIACAPSDLKEELLAENGASLRNAILETTKKRKTLLHEAGKNASLPVFRLIFEAPEKT